jgi:predicted metallo-beta-lactamase superfamily hydrolase
MIIKLLGAESLGVRGLSCLIELNVRKIFIDPGIALGWTRYGFLPHPFQIAIGAAIRENIIDDLKSTSDVIFSHFDGDHCPLFNPNPYQLGIPDVKNSLSNCRIWAKGPNNCPPIQRKRREELINITGKDIQKAEGMKEGPLEFSFPVPHGRQGQKQNTVIMSRIEENGITFVHASDIQLLNEKTIEIIIDWKPDIVLASGPPLYLYPPALSKTQSESAWKNALKLSKHVDSLIIDHHLLRSVEGIKWLEKLECYAKNKVCCAADFMKREPIFLEAWRKELYEWLPVSEDWHENYEQEKVNVDHYRIRGWESIIENRKIEPCKWYYDCPIKRYTEKGKLDRYWIENYCLVNNKNCYRYQMEEDGEYHPDNMLPNGEIRECL